MQNNTLKIMLCICTFLGSTLAQFSIRQYQQNDYDFDFERAESVWFNKNLIEDSRVMTFKYNRSVASFNASVTYKVDVETFKTKLAGYLYSMNEYKKTTLQFTFDLCSMLKMNVMGLSLLKNMGNYTHCPLKRGCYIIKNAYINSKALPPNVPEGRWKLETRNIINNMPAYNLNFYFNLKYKTRRG